MTVLLITFAVWSVTASGQLDERSVARQKYEAYKARVLRGDLAIDWRAFRLAAAAGEVAEGFDWQPVHEEVATD